METERALTVPNQPNKSVVATADNGASSLRSGRLIPAVPHFRRSTTDQSKDIQNI